MASQYAVDDSEWDEVRIINGYAVFLGYLMMGVRGLGLLIVTWTTVVLLGGFVSDLQKKDFWCLTGITLVQTAGVFDFLLKEKLSDMVHSWWGLLFTVAITVTDDDEQFEGKSKVVAVILVVIQVFVLVIVLFPLGVLYILGLYISAGVSLWRLIEHDFGDAGGANQKPALQVLYGLAVAQGMLFGYKTIYALGARNRLAKPVANEGVVDKELVAEYLEETVAGCEKNPSFGTGRNLVTYGVNLMMEAKSNEGFITGIRVLGGAIKDSWAGRKVLAKHLLNSRSDFWSHVIQRLLETVGPRSPYNEEVREHAARIVALVARDIRLEQFQGAIECISSMLDTSEESNHQQDRQLIIKTPKGGQLKWMCTKYGDRKLEDYQRVELLEEYELEYLLYERESPDSPKFSITSLIQWLVQCLPCKRKTMKRERKGRRRENRVHGFNGLLTEVVNIIQQLAVDEGNRRIIRNTMLQHKIAMAPLKLHRDNHHPCTVSQKSELQMLEKCWVLTEWLGAGVKETNSHEQILKDCSPTLQPADSPGGGQSRGEKIKDDEVEIEEEEECILKDRGAYSILLQPAAPSGGRGRGSGEKIEEEEQGGEECLLEAWGACNPPLEPTVSSLGGGREGGRRRNRVNIEEEGEGEGEGERLLPSMVCSSIENVIINNIKSTIKSIFDCLDCRAMQKMQGIQILLHLSLDMSFIMDSESRIRRLTWILLLIHRDILDVSEHWRISSFTDRNKCIRRLAGEKLLDMLQEKHALPSEQSVRELQLIQFALGDLTTAFVDDAEDISIRTNAVIIMEGFCYTYNCYIGFSEEVEEIMVGMIPKVVKEILVCCASIGEERQAQDSDVENGGILQGDVLESRTCQDDGYTDNERLRKALVSLCRDGYMGNIWLRPEFKKIAAEICKQQGKSFKYFKSLLVV